MGTYVYNMRKRRRKLRFADGIVEANQYDYSYKEWWSAPFDSPTERRREFIRSNCQRTADRAWSETDHAAVVLGDFSDGDPVYSDVTSPVWVDCNDFPGRLIGFIRRVRSRLDVVGASKWEPCTRGDAPIWRRYVVMGGVRVEETIARDPRDKTSLWSVPGGRFHGLAKLAIDREECVY